ncbi:MAG: hypothetical protein IOC39_21595 [Burkholderia sp.]|jgi:hypothetical protein|uniref:hypothetical protein n=1 Tax=Burkholderia sp. TaxID=36773 RepID=UPI00258A5BDC|nr:hypothetical protein [Burkholderia sp.]MCA3776558.1 hypothetical protein [Burkholderia sp.]MCA3788878.1 hypothetical protein [Burkholderia sp.]MCA3791137.1 hypothetical protein [Burkholderia sp.]MCA3800718.1 hypothetical protein [Burkholderia sp.]MCA3806937.1 hypothetical protein [Burkholderia sp.]
MTDVIALIVALGGSGRDYVTSAEFPFSEISELGLAAPFGSMPTGSSMNAFL